MFLQDLLAARCESDHSRSKATNMDHRIRDCGPAVLLLGAVSQFILSHSVISCCSWEKCFVTLSRKFRLRGVDFYLTLKRVIINRYWLKKGTLFGERMPQ